MTVTSSYRVRCANCAYNLLQRMRGCLHCVALRFCVGVHLGVYPANRDGRTRLTKIESMN
jgi:hypothetical protein